jgi:hypothetical protein
LQVIKLFVSNYARDLICPILYIYKTKQYIQK